MLQSTPVTPALGRQRQEDPWHLGPARLAESVSSRLGEKQISKTKVELGGSGTCL